MVGVTFDKLNILYWSTLKYCILYVKAGLRAYVEQKSGIELWMLKFIYISLYAHKIDNKKL